MKIDLSEYHESHTNVIISGLAVILSSLTWVQNTQYYGAIRVVMLVVSIVMFIQNVRAKRKSRPYVRTIKSSDWSGELGEFTFIVPASIHKKGKNPECQTLLARDDGSFEHVLADVRLAPDGSVTIEVAVALEDDLRLVIRK